MDKSKLARSHDRYGAGERESKDAIINSLTFRSCKLRVTSILREVRNVEI